MKKPFLTLVTLSLAASLGAQSAQKVDPPQMQGPPQASVQRETSNVDTAKVQEEMQTLVSELQTVSQRIMTAQEEARKDDEVQQALTNYGRTLRDEMLKIAPDQEEEIEQKHQLLEEIVSHNSPEQLDAEAQEAYKGKIQEYQQLRETLAQVESEAVQTEAVQEKQQDAQETQINKMKELEPELMELVQHRNELSQRLGQLRMQLQEQGQPRAPQPTTGS